MSSGVTRGAQSQTRRSSNIELLRVLSMFLIVLHHLSVHGPWPTYGVLANDIVIDALSFGGKIGVNCFVMITGYFLVKSNFKIQTLLKTVFETLFYSICIFLLFIVTNGSEFHLFSIGKYIFPVNSGLYWFISAYVALYLLSPIINKLMSLLSHSSVGFLISLGFVIFSVLPTITTFNPVCSNLVWFCYVYVLGGSIRLFYMKTDSTWSMLNPVQLVIKLGPLLCAIVSIGVIVGSAAVFNIAYAKFGLESAQPTYFIGQNKIPALYASIALFLLFANLKMPFVKFINVVGGSTLGVYLIHDNPLVRAWLWNKFEDIYALDPLLLLFTSVAIAFGVFLLCTLIDIVRKRCLEQPLFRFMQNKFGHQFDSVNGIFSL